MNPYVTIALEVFSFLTSHKDDLVQLIKSLEQLAVDGLALAGSTKADAVKGYIAVATNVGADLEKAWPIVSPIFNAFVADVKGTPKA